MAHRSEAPKSTPVNLHLPSQYENFQIFQILKFGPKIRKFRKGPPLQKSQKFPIFEKFYGQYRSV